MHYLTFSTLNSINQSCAEAHKLCRSSYISSTVDTTTRLLWSLALEFDERADRQRAPDVYLWRLVRCKSTQPFLRLGTVDKLCHSRQPTGTGKCIIVRRAVRQLTNSGRSRLSGRGNDMEAAWAMMHIKAQRELIFQTRSQRSAPATDNTAEPSALRSKEQSYITIAGLLRLLLFFAEISASKFRRCTTSYSLSRYTVFYNGSRPSDHYFRSVCLSVCLCRVFLSRLWPDFDQTRTYVIRLGLVVSPRI